MKKKSETKIFSREHKKYINSLKRNTLYIWLTRIAILIVFFGLWELFAYLKLIDVFFASSPSRIITTIKNLAEKNNLMHHIGITLYETIIGFALAVIFGSLIAILLWLSDFVRIVLEPYIVILNSLPKIALGPIIIVAFGSGSKSIIFMAILIGIIVTIINMLNGFLATDKNKIFLLKSMGAKKIQILFKLVIPNSMKVFISTLKIDVGLAWIGSIMGEYIASKAGLGYLLVYGSQILRLDLVMATIMILCILAGLMYGIVVIIEKLLIKH